MLAIARDLKVGTGTVQRIKREMEAAALSTAARPREAILEFRVTLGWPKMKPGERPGFFA